MFTFQSLEPNEYAILLNTKMELRLGVTLKLLISFFLTLFKNQVNTFIISYMFYRKTCGEQDRVVKEDYVSPHCSVYKQLWGCPPLQAQQLCLSKSSLQMQLWEHFTQPTGQQKQQFFLQEVHLNFAGEGSVCGTAAVGVHNKWRPMRN